MAGNLENGANIGRGNEVTPVPHGFSLDQLTDGSDRSRPIGLHEASGINLSLGVDPYVISRVALETISESGVEFEGDFLTVPGDESGVVKLVSVGGAERLVDWASEVREDDFSAFVPQTDAEKLLAELLVGPEGVLFTINAKDETGKEIIKYFPRNDFKSKVDYRLEYKDLFSHSGRAIESPILLAGRGGEGDNDFPDNMLEHVYEGKRYYLDNAPGAGVVSRSTLALIDAGVQAAKLSGLQEISMAALLAIVYDYTGFDESFSEPVYYAHRGLATTRGQILSELVKRWDTELGIEKDEVFKELAIEDEIAVRKVDLQALVRLYGDVTQVELVPAEETKTVAVLDIVTNLPSKTGARLLEELSERERQNIKRYAELLATVIERRAEYGDTIPEIISALVDAEIISDDIAAVHSEEFALLIGEGLTLAKAKIVVGESGVETSSLDVAFQAKLIEFMLRNADAISRTQQLAPEVRVNFDALMEIIERTRLRGRSAGDVAHVLGRFITAQERTLKAGFPALIAGIRQTVTDELGIELLNPIYYNGDRSGATLFVSTREEAEQIAAYVNHLFEETGIDKTIPVNVSYREVEDGTYVRIGDDALIKAIPGHAWLPAGKRYYRAGPKGS